MADQCIVCLENLDTESSQTPQLPAEAEEPAESVVAAVDATKFADNPQTAAAVNHCNHDNVALIPICGHVLHDMCLREWTEKANSCPICRQSFHMVEVYDRVGGTLLSSYKVEDKKQVAEFDPQAWLDDNPEEEEDLTPCPVCNRADNEEILLLCDGCDTPYHTHCINLDGVPRGAWFCMECVDALGPELAVSVQPPPARLPSGNSRRSNFFPRTQASMRRARQRARSDDWQGAWGQITGRVWDALSIDLDYHDDDSEDNALEDYRRSQQFRERERREHQRWQQRLNIASRLGARDVFENSIQTVFSHRPSPPPRQQPPPEQTREEKKAWGALEKARESEDASSSGSRKRKSRSVTTSPGEPRHQEPERKLKRPRTRRLPAATNDEASSSKSPAATSNHADAGSSTSRARPPQINGAVPSFLSSLLKEVEMSTPSDDENIRNLFGHIPGANDPSSPVASPSASGYSSPRATSSTPPPHRNGRPSSPPPLTLSSHIEPIYPPANYSPSRSSPENSDSEGRSNRQGSSGVRHPRPRHSQLVRLPRSQDVSPTRSSLPLQIKENISSIVRDALKPHWKSSQLTAQQYATINRNVSHKLYEEVTDPASIDDEVKKSWEKTAAKEVARAVSDLKA